MRKWLIFVFGIITGIILTFAFALCYSGFNKSGIVGLELFDTPDECMEYSEIEIFQVIESGCALANADDSFNAIVFLIPNERQQFYDGQKIILKNDQCVQRVGTYKYTTKSGSDKTIPAVRIIDGVEMPESKTSRTNSGVTLFDNPGDCVSRKDFEIQKVLESGDAIALEVREIYSGYVSTSDLEVLILAQEGSHFYNNQIVKAPQRKCARQIGTYKYQKYGQSKVIPVIAFK